MGHRCYGNDLIKHTPQTCAPIDTTDTRAMSQLKANCKQPVAADDLTQYEYTPSSIQQARNSTGRKIAKTVYGKK